MGNRGETEEATAATVAAESADRVVEFWFGRGHAAIATAAATDIAAQKSPLWWAKDAAVDREIAARFTAVAEAAVAGRLESWADTPHGQLALIICADQFPRNIWRGAPKSFAGDSAALQLARACVDGGADQKLAPIQRVFAYLPFEHSEELAEQKRSLALFQRLADDAENAAAAERELFAAYLDFAQQHHDIIARFGRFPHRNAILRRRSTDQELAFLAQPGSSF